VGRPPSMCSRCCDVPCFPVSTADPFIFSEMGHTLPVSRPVPVNGRIPFHLFKMSAESTSISSMPEGTEPCIVQEIAAYTALVCWLRVCFPSIFSGSMSEAQPPRGWAHPWLPHNGHNALVPSTPTALSTQSAVPSPRR